MSLNKVSNSSIPSYFIRVHGAKKKTEIQPPWVPPLQKTVLRLVWCHSCSACRKTVSHHRPSVWSDFPREETLVVQHGCHSSLLLLEVGNSRELSSNSPLKSFHFSRPCLLPASRFPTCLQPTHEA